MHRTAVLHDPSTSGHRIGVLAEPWVAGGRTVGVLAVAADDVVGGVDPTRGSGLRVLTDRVEALGGRLDVGLGGRRRRRNRRDSNR